MKKYFFLIFFISISIKAQLSGFNVLNIGYKYNKHLNAMVEFQTRQIEDFSTINYREIKGGIGYNFHKNHQAFIGTGNYRSFNSTSTTVSENRIWLQYSFSHNILDFKLDHRARAEKRFLDFKQKNETKNTERYRYRLSLTKALNTKQIEEKSLFFNAFNEFFWGEENPNFKRNRLYTGLGYVVNKSTTINLGYINQKEFYENYQNKKLNFLYLGINLSFRNNQAEEQKNISAPVND